VYSLIVSGMADDTGNCRPAELTRAAPEHDASDIDECVERMNVDEPECGGADTFGRCWADPMLIASLGSHSRFTRQRPRCRARICRLDGKHVAAQAGNQQGGEEERGHEARERRIV